MNSPNTTHITSQKNRLNWGNDAPLSEEPLKSYIFSGLPENVISWDLVDGFSCGLFYCIKQRKQAMQGENLMDASVESLSADQILRDEANFIQNVSQFYNTEALSDVILKIGNESYYGHKFVLAKSSDVFRTMLYERQWDTTQMDTLELSESPECEVVFDKFLRYLYTAEIVISTSTSVGILCLADKYNVGSLKTLCTQYMADNSRSPKVDNALSWYAWAKALHLPSLLEQCTKTIAWNYNDIMRSTDWLNMDADFVADLLQSSELVVQNEFALWEALMKWLSHENHKEELTTYSQKLLPLIRFPQMLVSQLHQVEQSELFTNPKVKDILHELLSKAFRYRSLCPSQNILGVSFDELFYMPRDYTDLTVDNVRMQNSLRFGIQVDVKMYRGPVPTDNREGEWKITYRKQAEKWSLQLYSHDTAMINNEARVECSIIIYNSQENVVQVHREPCHVCSRGNGLTIQITLSQPEDARSMAVLIKPVPS